MGLFGKSKKERETEYMSRLDVPSCLKEDFELIIDDIFTIGNCETSTVTKELKREGFRMSADNANRLNQLNML